MRDHALEQLVSQALAADPLVADDTLAVECLDGGHVVLRGSAESPIQSVRAVQSAVAVAGVRDVDDRLRPRRPGLARHQDARTEAAVLRALIADSALAAQAVDVRVADGTVTLSGQVDVSFQRDEAEEVARRVPGVSQLSNRLSVWMAVSPNEVLERISDAIGHDADGLTVTADGEIVTQRHRRVRGPP